MRFVDRHRSDLGRLRFLQCAAILLFCFLSAGVLWKQWVSYDLYKNLDEKQCLRRILYPATRGCIYDRNGLLLAGNRLHYQLVVRLDLLKKEIQQKTQEIKRLTKKIDKADLEMEALWAVLADVLTPYLQALERSTLSVSPARVAQHFYQELLMPLTVIDDLSEKDYTLLMEKIPPNSALEVLVENVRDYPNGTIACHALGYVAQSPALALDELPGNNLKTFFFHRQAGKTGLEHYYDEQLRGLNGGEIWMVDPSGKRNRCLLSIPSIPGKDLHTTLDLNLQKVCENALKTKVGAVAVLDAQTGEVLAMVSKPDFNLNDLSPRIPKEVFERITQEGGWLNRATQGLYPPGSLFKLIETAALLRNKVVDKKSSAECTGSFRVGNRIFHCHNHSGHGLVHLMEAIRFSCNPFFYKYAMQCGPELICDEANRFHLNEPTGIDLPYETHRMLIPSPQWKKNHFYESWTQGDTANLAIGQGFLRVTPLQMACFAASLSREETFTRPTLKKTENPVSAYVKQPLGLKKEDYHLLLGSMESSVEEGTSRFTYIKDIRIAGKSGTSQVKVKNSSHFKHIGWFIGFAPIEKPQIALAVMIEQTNINEIFWGAKEAVPVAKEVFDHCFKNKKAQK